MAVTLSSIITEPQPQELLYSTFLNGPVGFLENCSSLAGVVQSAVGAAGLIVLGSKLWDTLYSVQCVVCSNQCAVCSVQ